MRGRSSPSRYALRAFRIPRPPLAFRLVGPVRLRLTSAACAGRPPPQRRPDPAPKRRRLRRRASAQKGISPSGPPPLPEKGTYGSLLPADAEPFSLPCPVVAFGVDGSCASFHTRSSSAAPGPLRAKHVCSHRVRHGGLRVHSRASHSASPRSTAFSHPAVLRTPECIDLPGTLACHAIVPTRLRARHDGGR